MVKKIVKEAEVVTPSFFTKHRDKISSNQVSGIADNSAWKDENWLRKTETFFKVGNDGLPEELVDPMAYLNDASAFWSMHEQQVILLLLGCCVYFILVIF